jgi:type I restriction enzyme R subunit
MKGEAEFEYVEKPFLNELHKLGWDTIICEDETNRFDAKLTLRNDFDEVLLEERLKNALKKLNDWLDEEQIEDAVNEIKRIGLRKSLIEANSDFTNHILEPTGYKNKNKPEEKSKSIKIIDFEHPLENDFLAINQFRVNTPNTSRDHIIPDIVLFINGMPIGVIECKYPSQIGVNPMEEGINQLLRYMNRRDAGEREGNERLFHYNQIVISTYGDEARVGTVSSEYEHFLEWKDTYPIPTDKSLNSQNKLIKGALTKENFIDIIRNFTIFATSDKGQTIKVIARYPQFRAVRKAIDRITKESTPEKRSGVVWHTQGSGKSFAMVFLVRKIRTIEELKKFKVVLVTDRTDLETQLSNTAGLAETVYPIGNTRTLEKELKTDNSNLVMVMVQKFLKRTKHRRLENELPEYEEFPRLNDSENILILCDEGHRSQGGTFGGNLALALPKSTKIAFTGTPLISDKVKRKTYDVFGTYIDKYKMEESREDGATLQIIYEGKTVKNKISNKVWMEKDFEDMFSKKTPAEIKAIKKKYGTKGDILEAKKRIEAISKDLVKHYFENIFDDGFKAQIVSSSRKAAIRYKEYIDDAVKEYIKKYESSSNVDKERIKRMKFIKSVARITWENNDLPEWIKLAKDAKKQLGNDNVNFKSKMDLEKPDTGICFLIVKDMLLTGFDAPIEKVMYIDKRMTDHTLLQAIARVNRVNKNKEVGVIVDYYGVTNHLEEALAAYADEDVDDTLINIDLELPILKNRYEQLIQLFKSHGINNIEDYVNYKIKSKDEQLKILEKCLEVLEEIKVRADFDVKLKNFLVSLDILFSKPAVKDYLGPAKAFSHISVRANYRFRDDTINILGAGAKVKRLIDDYLISVGINTKIKPVQIISSKFEEEINKNKSARSKASEMAHAVRKHCKINYDRDPVYYKKITEKLQAILERYKENWDELAVHMYELVKEVKEGRKESEEGMDVKREAPFYDVIIDTAYSNQEISEGDKEIIRELIKRIINILCSEINRVDFWKSPDKIKELRAEIDEEILSIGINEIYDKKQVIVTKLLSLAKHKHNDLIK